MPIEIKVAPPSIVISQGRTFMVTDQRGEITPSSDEGVYARDTRFISDYHLYINREPWTLLTSSHEDFYIANYNNKQISFVLELPLVWREAVLFL
jgi:hypothetical protein